MFKTLLDKRKLFLCLVLLQLVHGFLPCASRVTGQSRPTLTQARRSGTEQEDLEEEVRLKVLENRRKMIRSVLKSADSIRTFRIEKGWVPELDENGKPIKSDGKLAVTLTAFVVTAGAIVLRIGGRAALVSTLGLDFVSENNELKQNLDKILDLADNTDLATKFLLFTAAWTAVKVFMFDAGGIALALSSGILFGGVLQGAVISAAAATIGSSVAFGLAQLDTPVRKKALEVLEEYPSLRGIEKVVAKDGLKAVLTLRLAPILPIPIGSYNYIYGVTKVPFPEFCGGIFLGSLKPYLLDSYLGYFGKSVIDGTPDTGLQDVLLLVALGVSVLIGVFASQLAGETWESVLEEVEAEKQAKAGPHEEKEESDGVARKLLGWELPEWIIGFQLSLKAAEERVGGMIAAEYDAKLWNVTKENWPPAKGDPARLPQSPEVTEAGKGINFANDISDGMVLTPLLLSSYFKFADPLYNEAEDTELQERLRKYSQSAHEKELESSKTALLKRLDILRARAVDEQLEIRGGGHLKDQDGA